MAVRKKIGLIYDYNPNWIGGTYYIENIIKAIRFLPENQKPELTVFYPDDNSLQYLQKMDIGFATLVKLLPFSENILVRMINRLGRIVLGRNIIVPQYKDPLPDYIYPTSLELTMIKNHIQWIADFQDRYLPEMFPAEELEFRKQRQLALSKTTIPVVFSSQSALNDYQKFYPDYRNKCHVLNFACIQSEFSHIDIDQLKLKFLIEKKYFFVPNQFWKHKNHKVVIEALNQLKKEQGVLGFCVVFTGKENDHRNIDYFDSLKKLVSAYGLTEDIKFLGFIDRLEQLQLMNNAISVIQPSLFEGWSTVVEDAKSMSQHLILSDLPVHREQVTNNVCFFEPHNVSELADCMKIIARNGVIREQIDYNKNIIKFARDFLGIFE